MGRGGEEGGGADESGWSQTAEGDLDAVVASLEEAEATV